MIRITRKELLKDSVMEYWKCNNCGESWVGDYEDIYDCCPNCETLNCHFEELPVSDVIRIEQTVDEKPLYEIIEESEEM